MQTENAPSLLCQGRGNFMKRPPLPLYSSAFICGYFRRGLSRYKQ